jgi:beta-lactamase regulating signal transducer with metallopeptidase domain
MNATATLLDAITTHALTTTVTVSSLRTALSPNTMQSAGWALLHFLWQGTALAALAAAAMGLCRRAASRYVVAVTALALMLAAPVATFYFFSQGHSTGADTAKSSPPAAATFPIARGSAAVAGSISSSPSSPSYLSSAIAPSLNLLPWLVEAWLLGVAFFSLRSAGGFLLLERERRRQSTAVNDQILEICYTLQERLGINRVIAYCECKWLQAPAVIGWFRPIVFLPATALTGLSQDQLQAVIAHELAHIRRFDPFVNVFQVGVETLLFYHPAVWWLNKKIRSEREHCCDDVAVSLCGNPVEYARALTLMESWRSAPSFAMAANRGPLKERIVRVLGLKTLGAGMRGIGLTGSVLCLTAALAAGNALLGMARPRPVQAASETLAVVTPVPTPAGQASPAAKATPQAKPSAAASAPDDNAQDSRPAPQHASSYIDAMKAAGIKDLTIDELIAMKTQDITPEYVHGLQAQGLHLDADKLIAMRVQGITPEYVRQVRASGLNPDEDQLIALKVQGVDENYCRELKAAGIQPDIDHLIAMKIQGVTGAYVHEMIAAGLAADADQIIALKVQDVSSPYLSALRDQGLKPTADLAIAMRIQDVTPEFVRDIRALGLNPTADELIAMRIQDATPEYVKAIQATGFKFTVDELIDAKIQDVTPEFIERAKRHGFKDLTLQKLIELRRLGILEAKADL